MKKVLLVAGIATLAFGVVSTVTIEKLQATWVPEFRGDCLSAGLRSPSGWLE